MTRPIGNSLADLFKALAPALVLYARQWTGPIGAEDVVQEVFVSLLAARRQPAEPRTWLFRCVRNGAISASRSNRRRGKREESAASAAPEWFVPAHDDRIDSKLAENAMSLLPIEQREILTLRIWSQMTLAEIREITGMPVSTIHDLYREALRTLRTKVGVAMSSEFDLTPEELRIEALLSRLDLQPTGVDEHTVWFEAGVRLGKKSSNRWQAATVAALVLAAGSFGWSLHEGPSIAVKSDRSDMSIVREHLPGVPAEQAVNSFSSSPPSLQDVIRATPWPMVTDDGRAAGFSSIDEPMLSVRQMLERAADPKDFLKMRS